MTVKVLRVLEYIFPDERSMRVHLQQRHVKGIVEHPGSMGCTIRESFVGGELGYVQDVDDEEDAA